MANPSTSVEKFFLIFPPEQTSIGLDDPPVMSAPAARGNALASATPETCPSAALDRAAPTAGTVADAGATTAANQHSTIKTEPRPNRRIHTPKLSTQRAPVAP